VFRIQTRREIAPNAHEIVIEAPAIAKKARAGQFVILMVDERSERVPYTLVDWDAEAGTVTLVVQEMGHSSGKLVKLGDGDTVDHLVGPLGDPIDIDNHGTVVLAGGCYGVGAILSVARAMKAAGNRVIAVVEARSHYLHYYRAKLEESVDELIQTTIDGSEGFRGHTSDVVKQMLERGDSLGRVVAVGCTFMMMLVAQETKPFGVRTTVALNPIMLDGTGMCGACRVTIGNETKFVCVDGPFFDAHDVDWEELWKRRAAYEDEEIQSLAQTTAAE
jgi:NAD(P)H-flavin reductase